MFRNWVFKNFPFLENQFDALTDYELFCKICSYVIEYSKDNEEMKAKIIEFQNYFDNLDVQEEINNKLDEMAASGQLDDIIAQYLELAGVLAYDTLNDLINADNIVNGSITRTLGLNDYKDGKGSYYKIRTVTSGDIVDGINIIALNVSDTLIAEKIEEESYSLIRYNKSHQLSDNVQSFLSDIDLSETFSDTWSITGFVILTINENEKGFVIANDWENSGGNKFTIKSFDYSGGTISNITTKLSLIDGHSNSMCKIDNNHILIIAMSHNYIYDVANNEVTEITNDIPYVRSCAEYKGKVYIATDYDHRNDVIVNKMYELEFDNSYNVSVAQEFTLENLYNNLKMQNQGMVIYEDLIIFPSYDDSRLIIYDFNTLKHLKTQLFTAPYVVEYQNGFVYDNKLLINDGYGKVYEPDIYGKRTYGDYTHNTITRSLTYICIYDDIIKLDGDDNREITINFTKFMSFSADATTNNGTLGSFLESITLYPVIRSYKTSTTIHNSSPIELPLFKNIEYEEDVFTTFEKNFSTSYTYYNETNDTYNRFTISGIYSFGGGDSVPTLTLKIAPYILHETFNLDGTQTCEIETNADYTPEIYITKIIGHRKVGLKY